MSFTFSTNITDIFKGVLGISLLVLAIVFVPRFMDKLDNIGQPIDKTTIEQIVTNVVKIHLVENNKELKTLLKELQDENNLAVKAMLDGTNAKIKEIADIVARQGGSTNTDPPVEVVHGDDDDPRRLETFVVHRTDADGKEYPTGIVYYSPNVKEGPKFSFQQYPLEVHATVVMAEEGEEEKRTAAFWIENNFVSTSRGNKYSLAIRPEDIRWAKAVENDRKFFWWNPRIGLGATFTSDVFYPNIGISVSSYGKTKRDMDWRFLDFTLGGTSDDLYAGITLFEYNLGNFIPLVENFFIGPNITYGISVDNDPNGELSYGLMISVPF